MCVVFSTFIKLAKKFCIAVNEPEGSLLREQNPTTGNYSKPAESSRHLYTCLCKIYFNMTLVLAYEVCSNTSLQAFIWHVYKLVPWNNNRCDWYVARDNYGGETSWKDVEGFVCITDGFGLGMCPAFRCDVYPLVSVPRGWTLWSVLLYPYALGKSLRLECYYYFQSKKSGDGNCYTLL